MLRPVHLLCLLAVFFAPALSGCSARLPGSAGADGKAPPGLSAKIKPEAEAAFTEARELCKRPLASVAAVERCSDPQTALMLLDKAISLEPDYAAAFLHRGLVKSELGRKEEAFDDLSRGIRLQPTAEAYAYRALASVRSGQTRAAQKDLEYSMKSAPSQHLAYNIDGVLALMLDRKAEACARFRQGCANGDCSLMQAAKKDGICSESN